MPLLSRIIAERWTSARDAVGRVYFANTMGSALGAFLAGFLLIPTIGLRTTIVLAAALDVAAAAYLTFQLRSASQRRIHGSTAWRRGWRVGWTAARRRRC